MPNIHTQQHRGGENLGKTTVFVILVVVSALVVGIKPRFYPVYTQLFRQLFTMPMLMFFTDTKPFLRFITSVHNYIFNPIIGIQLNRVLGVSL